MKRVTNLDELGRLAAETGEGGFALDLQLKLTNLDERSLVRRMRELDACPAMMRVHSLSFSSNGIESRAFARCLVDAPYINGLDRLDLDGNLLVAEDLAMFSQCDRFDSLRALTLNGNQLGRGALGPLGEASFFSKLISLDVGVNWVNAEDVADLLSGQAGLSLQRLVLGPNMACIGDEGAHAIASSALLGQLRHLGLTNNEIGDAGLRDLVDARGLSLESLSLCNELSVHYMDCPSWARNNISDAGVDALAASPRMHSLRSLSLEGNPIGDAGLAALRASPNLESLTECDVLGIGD